MGAMNLSTADWYKSSYSSGNGQCIETARGFRHVIPVRDSKDPHGAVLGFETAAWSAFVSAIKRGEFA